MLEAKLHGSDMYHAYHVAIGHNGLLTLTDDELNTTITITIASPGCVDVITEDGLHYVTIKNLLNVKMPTLEAALLWAGRLRQFHAPPLPDFGFAHLQGNQQQHAYSATSPPPAPGPIAPHKGGRVFTFPLRHMRGEGIYTTSSIPGAACDSAVSSRTTSVSTNKSTDL